MKKTINEINNLLNNKYFSGAVIKIEKNGKVLLNKAFGLNNIEKNEKMKVETIFPIYSMTKPIIVLATFLLIQEHKLSLDTKVCEFYSNFNEEITIRHLLNMTSGISYSWNSTSHENEMIKIEHDIESDKYNLDEIIEKINNIPISCKPGSEWIYGMNIDILGGIIEKITNTKLNAFLEKRVFNPLKMFDTDFKVKDLKRKAIKYDLIEENKNNVLKANENYHWMMPEKLDSIPNCCLGGSGLFSTSEDYNKFLNFMLSGKIKNKVILQKKYIKEITKNQLEHIENAKIWDLNEDYQYGYGVRVRIRNKIAPLTEVGEWGWGGILGTSSFVDPKNKIVMSFMVSVYPGNNTLTYNKITKAIYEDLKTNNLI
ncbi:serine hydrolase [Mesoplasma chauliocola]|uniref:Serine hydrolase n=1 Tax=Mesoplasma chauliocola TaxID=216427 RepID=A0A249SNZ2_9MOLU|nr:serine hydrolase domain-containing protein [Mesoplasma chauliocola]ASZ09368.1 serine hydrolase [Mesoplasma chauliocola]